MNKSYVAYANHPYNRKVNKSILETSTCTNTGKATTAKVNQAKQFSKYFK